MTPIHNRFLVICLSLGIALLAFRVMSPAQEKNSKVAERIGIYDSRAIAVAFAGSPLHEKQMQELKTRRQKAVETRDVEEVARCEKEGQARQKTLHRQGFSTAPVDDILALISDKLPAVQKEAAAGALVSKWNPAELARHPDAEQVDVTMKLVDALQPNPRQRQMAISIQERKPIPLEKIKD